MADPIDMLNQSARPFIAQLELLEKLINLNLQSRSDVYAEAKVAGHDAKILRRVIRLREKARNTQREKEQMEAALRRVLADP